jgi:calcineurin-like phosphoesterase family protein
VAKYLGVNDIHATKRPPSSCTDSYWPDLVDLLRQSADVAVRHGVAGVVWAGDVFHHKAPPRTDHGVVQDLISVIRAYPCPVWITPGNHDIQHDRLDSIETTQPLGVLLRTCARALEGWDGPDEDSQLDLYGVPWQQEWSAQRVSEVLADWRTSTYGCSLVVTHAPIYPPGREPRYEGAEFTPASWWAEAMGNQGYLMYGHIHEPHGVWRHEGVTFCNFGALSRGSLDEYNLDREVGVTIWDTDAPPERAFEFVPLDARPPEEVFRLRRHEERVAVQQGLDLFLSGVDAVTLGLLSVETVIEHIREGGHPAGVVNLAEELLMAQGGMR